MSEKEGLVILRIRFRVGYVVYETGIYAWNREKRGKRETENGSLEASGVLIVAEEKLKGNVRVILIVDVGVDFVVIAVCFVGPFVRAVRPLDCGLAGEAFSTDLDARKREEKLCAPWSSFTSGRTDDWSSGCAPSLFSSCFENAEIAGPEYLSMSHWLHCGGFQLLEYFH